MKRNKFIALALAVGMTFCNVATTGVVAYAEGTPKDDSSTKIVMEKESEGSLTIENTGNTTHTFELYQIFTGDLLIEKEGENETKTLSNIEWGGDKDGNKFSSPDAKYGETAADVAKNLADEQKALKFAKALLDANDKATSPVNPFAKQDVKSGENNTHTFDNLPVGYYLVKDVDKSQETETDGSYVPNENGAYTLYVLQIVGKTTAQTKLDVPESLKKVQENKKTVDTKAEIKGYTLANKYNDVADYSIDQPISYELVGTLPSNYDKYESYTYEFVDTMSEGLTLDTDSIKVYILDSSGKTQIYGLDEKNNKIKKLENISVTATNNENDKDTLNVEFTNLKKFDTINKDSIIIVDYTAHLNENAVIGLPGNTNEFHLVYSNNPNGEGTGKTPEDTNIVFTYELDVNKYTTETTGNTEVDRSLSGAEFQLYKDEACSNGAKVEFSIFKGWTVGDEIPTTLTTDANGLIQIKGLDAGTYYLKEIKAPDGYNKINETIKIEITANTKNDQKWDNNNATSAFEGGNPELKAHTTILYADEKQQEAVVSTGVLSEEEKYKNENGIVTTKILNEKGVVLPSTGGVGTTIMYVIGGILVICGGVAIFIKRKKDSE